MKKEKKTASKKLHILNVKQMNIVKGGPKVVVTGVH